MPALALPDFGDDSLDAAPDFSQLPGYEAGHAAGLAEAAARTDALDIELIQTLQEIHFGYAEAHAALLAELRPVLRAIVASVLPPLVDAGFIDHVTGLLEETAKAQLDPAPRVTVHPDRLPAVEAAVAQSQTGVTVSADAGLAAHAASVRLGEGAAAIDLTRLVARISAVCDDYFTLTTERTAHG